MPFDLSQIPKELWWVVIAVIAIRAWKGGGTQQIGGLLTSILPTLLPVVLPLLVDWLRKRSGGTPPLSPIGPSFLDEIAKWLRGQLVRHDVNVTAGRSQSPS